MRSEQLEHFREIARTKSINIAAEQLYISQPALSKSLQTLEKELELTLFTRNSAGVTLTEQGQDILPIATHLLDQLTLLQQDMTYRVATGTPTATKLSGHLTIFLTPTSARYLLPRQIGAFYQENPQVTLSFLEKETDNLVELLRGNEADLAYYMNINDYYQRFVGNQTFTYRALHCETLFALVSRASPLAQKEILCMADFSDQRLIFSNFGFEPEAFLAHVFTLSRPAKVQIRCSNPAIVYQLVAENLGVYLLNSSAMHYNPVDDARCKLIPLSDEGITASIGFLYRTDHGQRALIEHFIRSIAEMVV